MTKEEHMDGEQKMYVWIWVCLAVIASGVTAGVTYYNVKALSRPCPEWRLVQP